MAVIEVQLGLPPETNKKKGSNLTAVLRGNPPHGGNFEKEGTVFGELGNGALSNENSQFGRP